jgi:phage-related protein
MLNAPGNGENYGDVPTPFIYSQDSVGLSETIELAVNVITDASATTEQLASITILEKCSNLSWDSKTGLVTGEINNVRRPVNYSGNSLATIPVGNNALINSNETGTLTYNYWYY